MHTDILIIGAGPAGIFTAMELLRQGSRKRILLVEKGRAMEERRCPKAQTGRCVGCKPCMNIGCPAISVVDKKVVIDNTLCTGCGVCQQLCKFDALGGKKEA